MKSYFKGNQHISSFWIRAKKGLANTFKGYAQIGAAVVMVYVVGLLGAKYLRVPVYAEVEVNTTDARFAEKIEALKDTVVDEVADKCESKGYKPDAGVIVFDTNNKASLGRFQLQVKTVQYYEKLLYNRVISGQEAIEIAIDPVRSHDLARDIMFLTPNMAGKDWFICAGRLGTDAKIQIIKQLEK